MKKLQSIDDAIAACPHLTLKSGEELSRYRKASKQIVDHVTEYFANLSRLLGVATTPAIVCGTQGGVRSFCEDHHYQRSFVQISSRQKDGSGSARSIAFLLLPFGGAIELEPHSLLVCIVNDSRFARS